MDKTDEPSVARALGERISQGDKSAETELCNRYSDGLTMLLRKRSRDAMLAEDLRQECLIIVWNRLRRGPLDEPEKLQHFIHKTATNLLIANNRKLARRRTRCDIDGIARVATDDESPADAVNRRQVAAIIRRLLDEMSVERDRKILLRFYLKDHKKDDICADLDISREHFNRVLFRARGRFRKLLEKDGTRQLLRVVR